MLRLPVILIFAGAAAGAGLGAETARRPNVVVLLADDEGWGDLGATGNTNVRTPLSTRSPVPASPSTGFMSPRFAHPRAPSS